MHNSDCRNFMGFALFPKSQIKFFASIVIPNGTSGAYVQKAANIRGSNFGDFTFFTNR